MQLTFACGDYDRLRPLRDGRVRAEGLDITFLTLGPEEIFHRQVVHHEFDASEMSLGSYVTGLAQGTAPFVAIPIFPSRAFRHSGAYVNVDAGIERPEDLRGNRVGVAEYQLTANVWLRGILEDEYGVRPSEVRWFIGGLDEAGRRLKQTLVLPPEIHLEAISSDDTLSGMLERGDLDAIFTPRMPGPFVGGSDRIRRLFPDYRRVEAEYFTRTRIFPIMHTVVIRRDVYERDRWIAQSLVKALTEAKRVCAATIYDTAALAYMLPWMNEEIETVRALMGEDWWPYGLEPNRKTLETFLRYAAGQRIADRPLAVEDLFAPETLDTFKI
ncbi:MAG TPA: ABC transporter substrate-binding protein [Candidatus Limnocylindria bacterium]|jgi:4,5-dihydroxyphthalate decarboxylase|nr:ABC transporter substrate-binding protein [Candidatus Limnocylindria bacterium]